MAAPSVMISSCSSIDPLKIIKAILEKEDFGDGDPVVEDISSYPMHLNTKYYTADIRLCCTPNKTIGDRAFADTVQGFILHFDSKQRSSFDLVSSWLPFLKQLRPAIQILVCDQCSHNDVVSRAHVQKWCLENSFELVELNPEPDSDEEEDDFPETVGIQRIIQALGAHTWPNLVMKEKPDFRSVYFKGLMDREVSMLENFSPKSTTDQLQNTEDTFLRRFSDDFTLENVIDDSRTETVESKAEDDNNRITESSNTDQNTHDQKLDDLDAVLSPDDQALFAALGQDDPGGVAFEELFEKLAHMKEKSQSLPAEERKAYAEKVALAFWRAIGDNDDEIEGL